MTGDDRVAIGNDLIARQNLWLNKQLDDIGELIGEWDDVEPRDTSGWLAKLQELLRREQPANIGPPGVMHVLFHWRDREQKNGLFEALPGDGYGFAEAVEGFGLRMMFDCAGISANADLSFDMLRETLGKEGYGLVKLTDLGLLSADATVSVMTVRLRELEREVKRANKHADWLEDRLYGKGDNRDHARVAADRVTEYELTDLGLVSDEKGKGDG